MEIGKIIGIYLVLHLPAIMILVIGIFIRKTEPQNAKKMFIAAGVYFLIGAGLCGMLLDMDSKLSGRH